MDFDLYDRTGRRITMDEYVVLKASPEDYSRIDLTDVGAYTVSTVWLGINHRFLGSGAPVIFETLVFTRDGYWDENSRDGMGEIDGQRYCTEDEARTGHREIVELIRATSVGLDDIAPDQKDATS
jgi:hypothetical protein